MLDLRSLRYMVALSRQRSYSRAAEHLGITQSALSRSIQGLEERFGVRLFDRGRAGVAATVAGQQVIERAKALLASADDFEKHFRETAVGESGHLHFGMAPVPARALLAASLAERMAAAPGVRNEVAVRSIDALWPMLMAGDIEFLVAPADYRPDGVPIRYERLGRFPVSLMVRPGHPLLGGREGGQRYPLLLSSHGFLPRTASDGFLPQIAGTGHVIEDFDTMLRLTCQSDAIWLTSAYAVEESLAEGRIRSLPRETQGFEAAFEIAVFLARPPGAVAFGATDEAGDAAADSGAGAASRHSEYTLMLAGLLSNAEGGFRTRWPFARYKHSRYNCRIGAPCTV